MRQQAGQVHGVSNGAVHHAAQRNEACATHTDPQRAVTSKTWLDIVGIGYTRAQIAACQSTPSPSEERRLDVLDGSDGAHESGLAGI